jgi:hypothetical protein
MTAVRATHPRRQRGVAALFVVAMLCFVMVLVAALAQRNVLVEEQRSANELRSRIAFVAAEAGLEWALARVNDPTPVDATCLPSADAAATSFRSRVLRIDAASGRVDPATWSDAGTPVPLQAACIRDAAGWTCSCPASGRPALPLVAGGAIAPAFFVELAASTQPGIVRVAATACTKASADSGCAPADASGREATARAEIAWALLPALRSPPAAALTVAGNVDFGIAALGVANGDGTSGGLALHAGGRVLASALRIRAPPGAPIGRSIASDDDELRTLDGERVFARHFGMGPRAWAAQPAARRVACGGDCAAAIADAIGRGARLLFVDGDATIAGPAAFGGVDDPVVLVATGALGVVGDVTVHGVVHAGSLDWRDAAPGAAFVRGAVVVAGDARGNSAADVVRDGAVLGRLANASGSFVRVNGSWKDF